MATNSKSTAYSDLVLGILRGTGITAPASVSVALHKATTLSAGAAIGATSVSLPVSPIVGTTIIIDPDNAASETRTVTSVSGTGPYTVNFTGALVNGHVSGAYCQVDPGEDLSLFQEVSGGGYARQSIACNTSNFSAPSAGSAGRQTQNVNAINFAQASALWGYISHFVLFNSTTGWYYGAFSPGQVVNTNTTFSIPALGMTIQED